MRVIVDQELCEGNALCRRYAPEIFRVGDDEHAQVLNEHPGEELRPAIELAVRRCPRQAIRVLAE